MQSKAKTPDEYVESLPSDKKEAVVELRKVIKKNIPKGFQEVMSYGMIGYVVPHEIYPKGYHCDPKLPLPFVNLAAQKNSVTLYHMGLYGMPGLMDWFKEEYPKHTSAKLDMGKGCVRFKKPELIPYQLIGELMTKIGVQDYIAAHEKNRQRT